MPLAYHPFTFFLLFAIGAALLGVTANLVHKYNDHFGYPDEEFKHRLRYLLFCGCWLVFLAALHWLFNLGIGAFLLLMTVVFTGIGAGLWQARVHDLDCDNTGFTSICRQLQAVKGLSWAAFGISILGFLLVLFHVHGTRHNRNNYNYRSGFY